MNKQRWTLIAIFLLTFIGMALGLFMTNYHYKLLAQQEVEHTFICTLSASFNCDLVNSSPYSELFGVPIALWGFLFYLTFFIIALVVFRQQEKTFLFIILHCMALFSVFYSAYLFYIAEFVIGALCPYCIMMYGVNIGLFICTKLGVQKTYKEMWMHIFSQR